MMLVVGRISLTPGKFTFYSTKSSAEFSTKTKNHWLRFLYILSVFPLCRKCVLEGIDLNDTKREAKSLAHRHVH